MGAVTSTSISLFFRLFIADSSASNDNSPAVWVDLPSSIFTSLS